MREGGRQGGRDGRGVGGLGAMEDEDLLAARPWLVVIDSCCSEQQLQRQLLQHAGSDSPWSCAIGPAARALLDPLDAVNARPAQPQ